jgi:hypothetical protein
MVAAKLLDIHGDEELVLKTESAIRQAKLARCKVFETKHS